jgi:hypothetical protein
MSANTARTYLAVALLSVSLAAALSVGLRAQNNGVTGWAHIAGMQLQGMADDENDSADAEGNKAGSSVQRDQRPQAQKQDLVLALSNDRQSQDTKTLGAPLDEPPRKARN